MNTPRSTIPLLILAGTLIACSVMADEIIIEGTRYQDVYVRATARTYFVQTPENGEVISALRSTVDETSVHITADPAQRAALLARWKKNNPRYRQRMDKKKKITAIKARSVRVSSSEDTVPHILTNQSLRHEESSPSYEGEHLRSNGYVPYIKLKDVPLASALDAILRPMGLDYKIYGDMVYISTPRLLRREPWEALETRYYRAPVSDTLPKIVLRGPGTQTSAQSAGGSFGGQRGLGNRGGFGGQRGGFGGGGGFGAAQGAGFGGGGFGGGQGGGFGGGGRGGFGGGGDVTSISNISQLFSTIDDRLVGEAPATIGNGYYFQR